MYNIANKTEAIREIKKYLFVISEFVYPEIERNTIDGIYDNRTRASVAKYQQIKGLSSTGEVDYATFEALYDDFDNARDDFYIRDYVIEERGFPIVRGDISEDVRAIHLLINELAKTYTSVDDVGTGNYFSARTENAIKAFQTLFMMEETGAVDKFLFKRLKRELAARRSTDTQKYV